MNAHAAAAASAALFLSVSLFSHTVALRLLFLFAGAGLALYIVVRYRHAVRPLPSIWIPFVLWGAWAAASIFWSIDPDRSLKEFRHEILYTGLALWTCFIAAQHRTAARIVLPLTAVAVAVLCLVAVYWYIPGIEHLGRRWHGGPGDHSSALLTVMPCLAAAGWYGAKQGWPAARLVMVGILALLVIAAAYTTQNRTVWLGFGVQGVAMVAALLLKARSAGPISRRSLIAASLIGLAVAGAAVAATLAIHEERVSAGTSLALEKDPRGKLWQEVVELIEERPILGYGFGRGLLRGELRTQFDGAMSALHWHSHNLLLEAVVQGGIPGLVLLLLLLGSTARAGYRFSSENSAIAVACGVALIGVIAGMLVRNMTDMLWVRQNALLYWGVAGVLLGLAAAHRPLPS